MLNRIITFLLLFSIITAYSQSEDKEENGLKKDYQGLYWEVTGNGLQKTSYLYGTMHVSKKLAFHLSDTFFIGLKNCDVVALETNPGSWMDEIFLDKEDDEVNKTYGRYNVGRERLSGSKFRDYEMLDLSPKDASDFESMLRREHRMTDGMLYRSSDRSGDFEESTYLDLFIYQAGKKLGKEVTHLEDYKVSRKMVDHSRKREKRDDEYTEKQKEYKALKRKLEKLLDDGKSYYERIEDSYRAGDLDLLDTLQKLSNPSKYFYKWMVIERNIVMADNMDSIMKSNKSVFTGIGAAHLPGDMGVIELLRAKGYTVRPFSRKSTGLAKKEKAKIEKMVYNNKISKQYAVDSLFSVDMPGQLFETNSYASGSSYFYPDMANGAYYFVNRKQVYAQLSGWNTQDILEMLDSLFFENIPGEILKQKEIELNGLKGYDIVNKTAQGDYQHYQIFVTPLEVIQFKVAGTGDYLKKTKVDKAFFKSLKFHEERLKDGWEKMNIKGGGFSFLYPKYSIKSNSDAPHTFDAGDRILGGEKKSKDLFIIARSTNPYEFEEDTFVVARVAEKMATQLEDYEVVDYKQDTLQKRAMYQTSYFNEEKKNYLHIRTFIDGMDVFAMMQSSSSEQPNTSFFDGFKFLPKKYIYEINESEDTLLHFTVKYHHDPEKEAKAIQKEKEIEEKNPDIVDEDDEKEEENTFSRERARTSFYHYETGDVVRMFYEKPNKYSHAIDSSLAAERAQKLYFIDDSLFIVKDVKITYENSIYTRSAQVLDTNSSYSAIIKTFVMPNWITYVVIHEFSLHTGPTEYGTTILNTFKPYKDTSLPYHFSRKKYDLLYTDLHSEDSVTRVHAAEIASDMWFEENQIDSLISLYNNYEINVDDEDKQEEFEKNIEYELLNFKSDKTIPFFVEKYKEAGDTATLQIEQLQNIASITTEKAYKKVGELLAKDQPLSEEQSGITSLFNKLYDSLDLVTPIIEDLKSVYSIDEYKTNVLQILATMVDSGHIKPSVYSDLLSTIYAEASTAVKRKYDSEESDTYSNYRYSSYNRGRYGNYRKALDRYIAGDPNEEYRRETNNEESYQELSKLESQLHLLIHHYDKEAKYAKVFNNVFKTALPEVKFHTTILMLNHEKEVPDSILVKFSKEEEYRVAFYAQLEKNNLTEYFDTTYLNQKAFTKAILYGNDQDEYSYSYSYDSDDDDEEKKDSIVFITRKLVEGVKDTGYVYFYKKYNEELDEFKVSFTGLQPKDTTQVSTDSYFEKANIELKEDTPEEYEKLINKVCRIISWGGKRGIDFNDLGYRKKYSYSRRYY